MERSFKFGGGSKDERTVSGCGADARRRRITAGYAVVPHRMRIISYLETKGLDY